LATGIQLADHPTGVQTTKQMQKLTVHVRVLRRPRARGFIVNEWSSVPHREEDLLRLLDGALVLSPVRLRGGRAGAREPLDRGLELVQRPLLPALPRLGRVGAAAAPVGLLLERAAAQEGRAMARRGG